MDSDDELMFHYMVEEEANFVLDDEENQEVIRVLLAVKEGPNPNVDGL